MAGAGPVTHAQVQAAGGLLLVNHEKFPYRAVMSEPVSAGLAVYRTRDPLHPEQVAFWPSGGRGVHRVVWTGGRYAHLSAIPDGFSDRIWVVLDLPDPEHPGSPSRCPCHHHRAASASSHTATGNSATTAGASTPGTVNAYWNAARYRRVLAVLRILGA